MYLSTGADIMLSKSEKNPLRTLLDMGLHLTQDRRLETIVLRGQPLMKISTVLNGIRNN